MAQFTTDFHNPFYYWCLAQAALYIPAVKNLVFSVNMTRTNEHLPLSPYIGMSVLTSLEKIGLHLWEVISKVIHRCMSVKEFLNCKVFLMCVGDTMAMTGETKTKSVGLDAQERPEWEARILEVGPTNNNHETTGLDPQMQITEDPNRETDKLITDRDEVVLTDWLEWESEEEEEEVIEDDDDVCVDEENEKEQSLEDEEDSDWSDNDGDSEASTESTELWESFFSSNDPYNPLYFFCHSGAKAKSTDTTDKCAVPELKKSVSSEPEHSHEKNKKEGTKKVCFSEDVTVHYLVAWGSASRAARDGSCWLEMARDRERFRRRVEQTGDVLSPCLTPQHRARVWDRLQRAAQPEES